jgi:hypothetical protein
VRRVSLRAQHTGEHQRISAQLPGFILTFVLTEQLFALDSNFSQLISGH